MAFFITFSISEIAKYPVTALDKTPKNNGKISILSNNVIAFILDKSAAPKTTGILIKKAKFAIFSLSSPAYAPKEITVPLLDNPGTTASAWPTPITSEILLESGKDFLLFLNTFCDIKSSIAVNKKVVASKKNARFLSL